MVGVFHVVVALHSTTHPADARILVGADVNDVVVALILHGAHLLVDAFYRFVCCHEVLAGTSLVAKAPDDDRGVVVILHHHLHITCHVGCPELLHMAQRSLTVVVFVALNVGLVFKIDAVFVAEVVPIGVVHVVAVAHMVDVALLHQHHLVLHLLTRDGMAAVGVVLMTVNAFHLDGLAVEVIVASWQAELIILGCCLADFHGAEANGGGEGLNDLPCPILEFAHEGVAIGGFCAPFLYHRAYGNDTLCRGIFLVLAHKGYCNLAFHTRHGRVLFAVEFVSKQFIAYGVTFHVFSREVTHKCLHLQ